LKFFIGMPLNKLSRDLLAVDRKQYRLVNWPLHVEVAPTYPGPLGKGQVQENVDRRRNP
jgi:hypothetical protein